MASIIRIKATGSYRAQVRRKGFAPQCASFETKEQAVQWARSIEHKIDRREDPGANRQLLVAEVLRIYTQEREGVPPLSDSQRGRVNNLHRVLAKERVVSLSIADLESFCRYRIEEDGVQPQSVLMDLNTLSVAMRFYAGKKNTRLPVVVDKAAREHLRSLRLIADSPARSRRADARELKAILKHLPKEYHDVLLFAVASAMRRGEIARCSGPTWSSRPLHLGAGTQASRRDDQAAQRWSGAPARRSVGRSSSASSPAQGQTSSSTSTRRTTARRSRRHARRQGSRTSGGTICATRVSPGCSRPVYDPASAVDLGAPRVGAPEALHAPEAEGPAQARHAVAQDGGRVGEGRAYANEPTNRAGACTRSRARRLRMVCIPTERDRGFRRMMTAESDDVDR